MTGTVRIGQRDLVLLEALALRVRLLGQRQIADALWSSHLANARRRLSRLAEDGLLVKQIVPARPLPEFYDPVVRWQPGQQPPHFGAIAYQLQNRWKFRALRPTVVYFPTAQTVTQFGGGDRSRSMVTQVTHDLGVTAVWLRFHLHSPKLAANWSGEDLLASSPLGQKQPDAALLNSAGDPEMLIEFGGAYGATRIAEFHNYAAACGLPYQIW